MAPLVGPGRPAPRQQRRIREREEAKARRRRQAARREWWTRHRRTSLAVLAGGVAVAGIAAGLVVALSPGPPATISPPVLHTVLRASAVSSVTEGLGAGWLTDDRTDTLVRFGPSTGRTDGTALKLPGRPVAVTTGFGRVWVASMLTDTVEEVRPGAGSTTGAVGTVVRTIHVPAGPSGLAVLDGRVWVTSVIAGDLTGLDPASGRVAATAHLPQGAVRLAAGDGRVWVTGSRDTVAAVNPRPADGRLRWRTVTVGRGPLGVTVGNGSVWVADATAGTVSQVDPTTLRVTRTYKTGPDPIAVAVSAGTGRTFVADGQTSKVTALAVGTGSDAGGSDAGGKPASATLDGTPRQLVTTPGGAVWAAVGNPGAVIAIR